MKNPLPSLNAIRSFASAGRHLSFTAAAAELNVTQGAVSRLVQSLEREVGVALFTRRGRSIELTRIGAEYHRRISAALLEIAAASDDVRPRGQGAKLSINVLPTLALRWLVPRLADFQARHPEVHVEVTAGDGAADLDTLACDMAIRFGAPPFPGAEAHLLMGEAVGVICSPEFLRHAPPIRSVKDLPGQRLLRHTTRPDAWSNFLKYHDIAAPDLSRAQGFEHFFMLAEAAAAGMGVALIPLFLIDAELRSGRLIQAVPDLFSEAGGYYLLHRSGAERNSNLRMFKVWLMEQAENSFPL
ncbi:LysR substrate-binding domain-containing protein [Lacibacterium aquatile]|uniref:LysR substrate-binding domain-containing protein n=1 Tax=Lacibacterium aquatile TaxID=1168082 RepID=A0ABW5DQ55_9PROT